MDMQEAPKAEMAEPKADPGQVIQGVTEGLKALKDMLPPEAQAEYMDLAKQLFTFLSSAMGGQAPGGAQAASSGMSPEAGANRNARQAL